MALHWGLSTDIPVRPVNGADQDLLAHTCRLILLPTLRKINACLLAAG